MWSENDLTFVYMIFVKEYFWLKYKNHTQTSTNSLKKAFLVEHISLGKTAHMPHIIASTSSDIK